MCALWLVNQLYFIFKLMEKSRFFWIIIKSNKPQVSMVYR